MFLSMVKMDRHWVQLRGTCPMQLSKLQQQPQHPLRYCYAQARRLILSALHQHSAFLCRCLGVFPTPAKSCGVTLVVLGKETFSLLHCCCWWIELLAALTLTSSLICNADLCLLSVALSCCRTCLTPRRGSEGSMSQPSAPAWTLCQASWQ